jgi:hypothetical protein|eukprot:COSAG06_NODE_4452_length_4248_cov_7.360087_3_plen_56_part_00
MAWQLRGPSSAFSQAQGKLTLLMVEPTTKADWSRGAETQCFPFFHSFFLLVWIVL